MGEWVGRSLREVLDWGAFGRAIGGAGVAGPVIAVRAAREAVKVEKVEDKGGIRSFRLQDTNKVWWEIANLSQKYYDDAFAKGDVMKA